MTDARYPEKWLTDRRFLRLTGDQHTTYVRALAWCVSNRTDGVFHADDLALLPCCDVSPGTTSALVAAGLWETRPDGWFIVDFEATQTTRDALVVLENTRRREREKKRRQRGQPKDSDAPSPGTSPGKLSPGTAQDRTGKDRTGKAVTEAGNKRPWPTVAKAGEAA